MPEAQACVENDDDFGDFEWASSSLPSALPNPNPLIQEDDEWGDFIESPLQFNPPNTFFAPQSHPIDLFTDFQTPITDPPKNPSDSQLTTHLAPSANSASPGVVGKQWEKPQGAIPLSIFGDEEEEEEEKPSSVDLAFGTQDGFSSKREVGAKNGFNLASGAVFDDFILNLYGQDERIKSGGDGLNSDQAAGDDDFDEDSWEFKDASIDAGGGDGDLGKKQQIFEFSGFETKENTVKSESQAAIGNGFLLDSGLNVSSVYGNNKSSENGWKSNDALLEAGKVDGSFEEKKEWKVSNALGADTKVPTFDFEIQVEIGNGVTLEKGSNLNSTAGDTNFDENGWEFKDAFPGSGTIDCSSGHKKEQKAAADTSGIDTNVLTFDSESLVGVGNGVTMEHGSNFNTINVSTNSDEIGWGFDDAFPTTGTTHCSSENEGFGKMFDNQQLIQPLPTVSNGKQDSIDMFVHGGFLHKPATSVRNGINGSSPGSTIAFSDLISSLYNQAVQTSPIKNVERPIENGYSSSQLGSSSDLVSGDDDWDENGWEFRDAFSEARTKDQNSGFETLDTYKEFTTDLKLKNFVNFYSRLKEESFFFVLHHLDGLKKAKKVAAFSGEEVEVMALDEKIQTTYGRLKEEIGLSVELHLEEHPLRNSCAHELIEIIQDPEFRAFELEYNLLKQIQAAEKELSSAVKLLEHATSTQHIMKLASKEEQATYVSTWSKMITACAQELQHGAMIWKRSLEKNVHLQILSEPQGLQYFVSLGEVYRVAEVLRASATLYKPWILSDCGDSTSIFVSLEECKSTWMDSGLKEALESISSSVNLEHKWMIKALLESINSMHELDALALQNLVLGQGEPICRLSLLSSRVSRDMKLVFWNGEHYFLKLANLWANRLSCDPPELPQIHVQ